MRPNIPYPIRKWKHMLALLTVTVFAACEQDNSKKSYVDIPVSGEMEAVLTSPPLVPEPVGDRPAKKLIVKMEIVEKDLSDPLMAAVATRVRPLGRRMSFARSD